MSPCCSFFQLGNFAHFSKPKFRHRMRLKWYVVIGLVYILIKYAVVCLFWPPLTFCFWINVIFDLDIIYERSLNDQVYQLMCFFFAFFLLDLSAPTVSMIIQANQIPRSLRINPIKHHDSQRKRHTGQRNCGRKIKINTYLYVLAVRKKPFRKVRLKSQHNKCNLQKCGNFFLCSYASYISRMIFDSVCCAAMTLCLFVCMFFWPQLMDRFIDLLLGVCVVSCIYAYIIRFGAATSPDNKLKLWLWCGFIKGNPFKRISQWILYAHKLI